MAAVARIKVEIKDFLGLVAMNSHEQQDGEADEQVNCCTIRLGELETRGGYREVVFD